MLKVCFITDGGTRLGLGHVQQSVTFAHELTSQADICFLTKSDETVVSKIRENGFLTTRHKSDIDILSHLELIDPNIIIFDKLDVAEDLAKEIKRKINAKLVIFTNLTNANKYADIAITADIGSRFENVRFCDKQTGTIYLYGPKYWVLRPEFYEYHRREKEKVSIPTRILLIFGGSDPENLTVEALDQLLYLSRPYTIDVILGAHYPHADDLMKVRQRHGSKLDHVTFYQDIKNVAEIMHSADVVLAAPGLSAFEALCVNTPVIVVPHDDLQRDTYRGFMCMLERGELSKLGEMLEAGEFTYPDDKHIVQMDIGNGIQELKELIINTNKNGVENNEVG